MRIVYFDTLAGISGDMTLGAFVSAGVPLDLLTAELHKLPIRGFELDARHVERSGISAVKIDVVVSEQPRYHRHLHDILEIVNRSGLSVRVKNTAEKIFRELAVAEAKVHNTEIEKVHFHEVGALDAIVDIVGAAICLEIVGAAAVYSSAIRLGNGGLVNTEHGKMPIPAPATVEILRGYPTVLTDIPFELTTPTGASIVKATSRGVLASEKITIESVGYGAGSKEFEGIPNLLRIFIGDLPQSYEEDETVVIETNIDDMNPEIYPYVIERLLETGAHDAYLVPVVMKKGRPGILLSAFTPRGKLDAVLSVIFQETTTLVVRIQNVERKKLPRSERRIQTSFGEMRVKVVMLDGKEKLVPEFEECKRIALKMGISLRNVYSKLDHELGNK